MSLAGWVTDGVWTARRSGNLVDPTFIGEAHLLRHRVFRTMCKPMQLHAGRWFAFHRDALALPATREDHRDARGAGRG